MKKTTEKNTALAKYDARFAELAKRAKQAVSNVASGGNFISLKGGVMSWQGAVIQESKIRCIVIDAIAENQFYEGSFDPENFTAPTCFAFGRDDKGDNIDPDTMAPHADAVEPQHESCSGCPQNQWGSADVGRGKACKEVQRLALITEAEMDNIEDAEIAFLKVPVTSVKTWAGYVRDLANTYNGMPPLAFVTEIAVVKENTSKLPGWHLEFKIEQQLDDPQVFDALFKKYEAVSKKIAFPYVKLEAGEATANGKGKQRAAKPAPKAPRRPAPPVPVASAAPVASSSRVAVGLKRPVKQPKY